MAKRKVKRTRPVSRRRETPAPKQRPNKAIVTAKEPPAPQFPYCPEGMHPAHYLTTIEWLSNGYNGAAAYLKHHPEASPATARVGAHRILISANAQAVIREWLEATVGPLQASAAEMTARVGAASRFDPADCFDAQGALLPVNQWPVTARMAVKGVKPDGSVTFESRVALARLVFELEGRLKNPLAEAGDALADAIRAMLARRQARQKAVTQ